MNKFQKMIPLVLIVVVAIVGLVTAGYYYLQFYKSQNELKFLKDNPQIVQISEQDAAKQIISEVGKLMQLPENEQAIVATINDKDKFSSQPFFTQAKNGDKILIYPKTNKAILYDPITKKVLDVSTINLGTPSAEASMPKIVIKVGTQSAQLVNQLESELEQSLKNDSLVSREKIGKSDRKESLIYLSDPKFKSLADSAAKKYQLTPIFKLPSEEKDVAGASLIIFLGTNFK